MSVVLPSAISLFSPVAQPFPGTQDNKKLFKTTAGLSFKCKSELVVKMASDLRLKIVPAQFQPFNLANGQFGKGRRIIPS